MSKRKGTRPRRWMKGLPLVGVALGLVLPDFARASCLPLGDAPGMTTLPIPSDRRWMARHEAHEVQMRVRKPDVLLVGDSIVEGWPPPLIAEIARGGRTLNLGVGGDRIQNLLWRLDHLDLRAVAPHTVLVMIGTNNVLNNGPCDVANGIMAAVDRLRGAYPGAKIIVLGLLLRESLTRAVVRVNAALAASTAERENVRFVDANDAMGRDPFANFKDGVHPTQAGYAILTKIILDALYAEPLRVEVVQ